MAHKKAGGSSRNGRDSESKRLGVKAFGGELINAGSIIVRQQFVHDVLSWCCMHVIVGVHAAARVDRKSVV